MKSHLVSIVITTKNEERNIENCLISIQEQTYSHKEIIVVDNNSTDGTKTIAKKYTPHVFEKGPERSAQRNHGMIQKGRGKYVMFVDADMILSPFVIEACVAYFKKHRCYALHIPEIILGTNFWSRVRRFERGFYNGTSIDGARFFDRDVFTYVGGFDETMSGPEDWDIDKKLKQRGEKEGIDAIGLLSESPPSSYSDIIKWKLYAFIKERGVDPVEHTTAIFHNESEFEMGHYLSKKAYYATSFDSYVNKWGKHDPDVQRQLGLWYRYIGVFIEHGKWRRLCAHPWLTVGMCVLKFLVGVMFITRKR